MGSANCQDGSIIIEMMIFSDRDCWLLQSLKPYIPILCPDIVPQKSLLTGTFHPGSTLLNFIMAESPEYYWLNSPSIIVDDSDSTINYDGTWQVPNRTETAQGLTGSRDPILDTRHILQIFNGSFSYNFTGMYKRCAL